MRPRPLGRRVAGAVVTGVTIGLAGAVVARHGPVRLAAGALATPTADVVDDAVTLAVIGVGGCVALWYLVSALGAVACLAAAAAGRRWRAGEDALRRWGAPALRRAATVAVGLSLAAGTGVAAASSQGASSPPPALPDDLRWLPVSETTGGSARAAPSPTGDGPPRETAERVRHTVRPGDSLWSIAREAWRRPEHPTNADVAAEWPRWYAANRAVIGADPNLIRPGQELLAPHEGDDR